MSNRIVIVGGGYAGAELARSLDTKAEVTLVEQRSHFVHSAAMIRALVTPELMERAMIPYDKLLKRGTVVQATVASVDETGVTLSDNSRIDADYVVLATGSDNATPFKPKGADVAGLREDVLGINGQLKAAKTIAIVGAGAVGTELAGEIAHFMPEKKVTLISGPAHLFPDQPAKLGQNLAAKLKAAGVTLVLGTRAENLDNLTEPYSGTLTLSDGQTLSADLIFPVIGSRANSDLFDTLPNVGRTTANRVVTDGYMRPSSLPNVFATGDVADNGDAMTIVATMRQVPWLTKTLIALISSKTVDDLKPYTKWNKPPILVPLGPNKGNSYLSLFTVGDLLTRQLKGKDLFIKKNQKAFGRT